MSHDLAAVVVRQHRVLDKVIYLAMLEADHNAYRVLLIFWTRFVNVLRTGCDSVWHRFTVSFTSYSNVACPFAADSLEPQRMSLRFTQEYLRKINICEKKKSPGDIFWGIRMSCVGRISTSMIELWHFSVQELIVLNSMRKIPDSKNDRDKWKIVWSCRILLK